MNTWVSRKEQLMMKPDSGNSADQPIPDIITKWIARIHLLYGVPFEYLVPDSRMLPMESIRFFHVDENWMNNLIDGALSIGRVTQNDLQHDERVIDSLKRVSGKKAQNIRRQLLKKSDTNEGPTGVKTGFILRSLIVEGWPGLEVNAYKSKQESSLCTILRMERLAKDVMLCIFDGEFEELELREPAEAMHFGVDFDDGKFLKKLRSLGVKSPLGTQWDVSVNIPFRDADNRTLNVNKLVDAIKSKLKDAGEYGGNFYSPEFAVEMIESAQKGVFDNVSK